MSRLGPLERDFLAKITGFCDRHDVTEWKFKRLLGMGTHRIDRVRRGGGLQTGTIYRVEAFIAGFDLGAAAALAGQPQSVVQAGEGDYGGEHLKGWRTGWSLTRKRMTSRPRRRTAPRAGAAQ